MRASHGRAGICSRAIACSEGIEALFVDRARQVTEAAARGKKIDGQSPDPFGRHATALATDQAILVEFTHVGQTVRVFGFSGRPVELQLDGRPVRFAPLLTGAGSVLLAGENFAWQPELPARSPPRLEHHRPRPMKTPRLFAAPLLFLGMLGATAPLRAGGGLHLVGVEEQTRFEAPAPLLAGQPATLELLIPPQVDPATLRPRVRQLAGALGAPLAVDAVILPSAAIEDTRVIRLRLTPSSVQRVTRLALWLGEFGPVALTVFPAADKREDLPPSPPAVSASPSGACKRGRGVVC